MEKSLAATNLRYPNQLTFHTISCDKIEYYLSLLTTLKRLVVATEKEYEHQQQQNCDEKIINVDQSNLVNSFTDRLISGSFIREEI